MTTLKLRYGDLLQLLERLHALPGSRRTATESRLKNFSRMDFPNGPRVGSGERAEYGADQVIQLLFAFELLRLRVPPAVIAEIARTEWTRIAATFADVARSLDKDPEAIVSARRPMLAIDAVALHEAGKTVRPGELLSTIEVVFADELFKEGGRRSALTVDPTAVLADAAALVPTLRRSTDADQFLADVAALGGADATSRSATGDPAAGDWQEIGYSRRRALADTLATLRAAPPLTADGEGAALPSNVVDRLEAALSAQGRPLSRIMVDGRALDASILVYMHWVGVSEGRETFRPRPADILAITTAMGSPRILHEQLVAAILDEIGTPAQDI